MKGTERFFTIVCADEECREVVSDKDPQLLLIGNGFKCPRCRGRKFILKVKLEEYGNQKILHGQLLKQRYMF